MNEFSFKLKGLGYFIDKIENKLIDYIKIIYTKSTSASYTIYNIFCNFLLKLIQNENLEKVSRQIIILAIFMIISKQIYITLKANEKYRKKILSSKPEIFFENKKQDYFDKEIKLISKYESFNKINKILFISDKNKIYKRNNNNDKSFLKIFKALLDYENYKKNFY